jgi:predicted heme/steroid binding protein
MDIDYNFLKSRKNGIYYDQGEDLSVFYVMSRSLKTGILSLGVFMLLALSGPSSLFATEDYADLTGQDCSICHLSDSGGGGLTPVGEAYEEDPSSWRPQVKMARKAPIVFRFMHFLILYLHIFFGIIWVGTILYVHLVLKPQYALGGLPRSELRLAWISMPVIAVTGVLLTAYRLKAAPGLFQTDFGKLLLGKMGTFTLMLISAVFVTLFVGPRLRKIAEGQAHTGSVEAKTEYTPEELYGFNGEEGRKILVAVDGDIWDLSSSPLWRNGLHAGRHKAGKDLTEYLKGAPHEQDVLSRFERAGKLTTATTRTPPIVRIFTINAYFNLIGCFLIILFIALWRW